MRFFENGPAIPDGLLHARDEGRVVFFCGAGVSRAKAGLPDFFGLAEKAMETLGVLADSPARKLLEEARSIEDRTSVAGVIPADRIFGLLEREFSTDVIEAAVASSLRPDDEPDLTAHRTILDLATTTEGLVHVVTTNFDRLFDDCRRLKSWQRPRLPDPSRPKDMDGIVYLHGKATSDYQGAEGDGFVLSSPQFGQAYLSEGWATSFFREIIDEYVVVFVGYAADDPPVHYLLEGLNRQIKDKERQVYAFQAGDADDVASKWGHRGVKAISYAEDSGHTALWDTLEAWAQRARDPDKWYAEAINKAKQGPQSLSPHERGQVAHIVSTVEGVRKFSEGEEPPPAEWLCVFDKYRRYGEPGKLGSWLEEGPDVDPFDLYHIDSDVPPAKANSRDRKPSTDAWDAFNLSHVDKTNLSDENFPSITGRWAYNVPPLPSRLRQMGAWIRGIADQPAAVWWAVRQPPLHPDIRREIRLALTDSQQPISPAIREAWYYLLEYWEQGRDRRTDVVGWSELKRRISKDGWSRNVVRAYAECSRPYLKVEPHRGSPKPPEQQGEICLSDLIHLEVEYPDIKEIEIPKEWVAPVVVVLRKNLETALELETEAGGVRLALLSSIVPDNDTDDTEYGRTRGLSGAVIRFTSVFECFMEIDLEEARHEFSKWPIEDDTIFTRLRIWAAGKSDLMPDDEFGSVLTDMSDEAFWDDSHEWDLLHTLLARWDGLKDDTCVEIEKRILKGRVRRKEEDEEEFKKWRTLSILARITWLSQKGCKLHLNLEEETDRLRGFVPDWKPEHVDKVVRYSGITVRSGEVETDYSALLDIPLACVLPKARSLSGRRDKPFVRYNPFGGLSADRPIRAFSALRVAAEKGDFPDWAWSTFLNAEGRKTDKPRFMVLIAERLACYLENGTATLVRPAASWLMNVSNRLADQFPASFRRVTRVLIQALKDPENRVTTAIVFNAPPEKLKQERERELVQTAAQTARAVAQAFFHTQKTDLLKYVDELLVLPSDLRRQVLTIFAQWMNWFYAKKREWSEKNLIAVLDSSNLGDRDAFWGGFFSRASVSQELFMRLKPHLLRLVREDGETRRKHSQGLSSLILSGWGSVIEGTSDRCISNKEFRAVLVQADDEFRSHVLHEMRQLWNNEEEETRDKWTSLLPEFLRDVWPRERKATSPAMSVSLCRLVLSNEELFPNLVDIILPCLTKTDDLLYRHYLPLSDNIAQKHPHQMLNLLYKVLPDETLTWPYDIEEMLASISEGDPSLRTNEKFLELKRRWDSR